MLEVYSNGVGGVFSEISTKKTLLFLPTAFLSKIAKSQYRYFENPKLPKYGTLLNRPK
jgi:hypothetical protein